ncbi:uncharacterized protein LOC117787959 [Drosophila innubila]|uniref:uncharacterized protein LOC117787959 n=1 Tax=Drosophila innubila TaxID=198719 RepID=UPI00148BCE44|nr:uncharacterized protein LOC117787959 [Drosophila innubila]
MQRLGLGCPLGFLASKPQKNKTIILDLNYDCYVEIFSYLTALDDKLNLARAHPQFRDVLIREAPRRFAKINMRMLRCISDWDYLLHLCGDSVLECELRHGRWDDKKTLPFLALLNTHCKNMQHLHLIFVHYIPMTQTAGGDVNILQVMQRKDLKSMSLTDAKAPIVLQLQHFMKLEALHIDGIDDELLDADFMEQLEALPALRRLALRFASRRQYPPLADHCPQLEHLSLENFEATLADVGDFPQLKSLHLRWRLSIQLNKNLFRMLAKRYSNRLEQLQLTIVNPAQATHIVALENLKMLACPMWPSEALTHLSRLQQLECLALQCTEAAVSLMQLLDVVTNCYKLQHLKLGKRWLEVQLEDFVIALQDVLRRQAANAARPSLLMTLESPVAIELQNQLRDKTNFQLLQLDWQRSICGLCKPDRHSKHEVFLD